MLITVVDLVKGTSVTPCLYILEEDQAEGVLWYGMVDGPERVGQRNGYVDHYLAPTTAH